MVLTHDWVRSWSAAPGSPVITSSDGYQRLTAAEVERLTAQVATRLHDIGIRAGDRVLLSSAASIETVLAYIAILRLSAIVVPANTAYTASELAHVVADCQPLLAVIDDVERLAADGCNCLTPAELLADSAICELRTSIELDAATDSPAMIAYTSGTTGKPKGALLTSGNLLAGARALVQAWSWSSDDVLIHALPMFHMHGLGAGLNGTFTAGASVVVVPRFEVDAVTEAITQHQGTMFFGVPTMYARFVEQERLSSLSSLRIIVSGSAPLDPALFTAIEAATGFSPVERYGMSETVMLLSNPLRGVRKPGSVGLPLPDVEVRLDEHGGVEVRGPNVFSGYWGRSDATSQAFTADGWFKTGDIGRYDDDGYLYLIGRESDLIITGGYNVYPREVEDVLRDYPGIVDVAVVGLPDPTWGERIAAYYVSSLPSAIDETDIAILLEERLAGFKHPRVWVRVDELPRNAMGKVRRDVLREQGMMDL